MLIASNSKRTILRCGPLTAERITRTVPSARAYWSKRGYCLVVIPRSKPQVTCSTPLAQGK